MREQNEKKVGFDRAVWIFSTRQLTAAVLEVCDFFGIDPTGDDEFEALEQILARHARPVAERE